MIEVELNGQFYDATAVIGALQEQVLPGRFQKIRSVIEKRNPNLVTMVENIYDRGNTSAVMRSAEAFGFYRFHQVIQGDDFKESKRVTQGADKWLVQKTWPDTQSCVTWLRAQGHQILVTHLDGGVPLSEVSFGRPTVLCLGNERDGASQELTEMADQKVFIPMQGFVQSFNISVAAALCFQHIHREMQDNGAPHITDEERQRLLALYLFRSCQNPALPPAVRDK